MPMLLAACITCLGLMHAPLRSGHSVRPRLPRSPLACDTSSADDHRRQPTTTTTQHSDDRALLAHTQQLPPRNIAMALTRLVLPCVSCAALIWTTTSIANLLNDHLDWVYAWNGVALFLFTIGLQAFPWVWTFGLQAWALADRPQALDWQKFWTVHGSQPSARLTTLTAEAAETVGVPPPKHVYELCISKPCACAGDVPGTGESAIGVSTGLLGLLTETELSAVIAHELGHLRHKDLLHDFVLERGISGLKAPFDHGMRLALSPLNPDIPDSRALQFVLALYLTAAGSCPYLLALLLTLAEKAVHRGFELDADLAAAHAFGAEPTICFLSKLQYATDATGSLYYPLPMDLAFRTAAKVGFESRKEALEHDYYGLKRSLTEGELKEAGLDNPVEFAAREVAKCEAELRTKFSSNTPLRAIRKSFALYYFLQSKHPTFEVRIAAIEKAVNDGRVPRTITAAPNDNEKCDDDTTTRVDDELNVRPEFAEFAELFVSSPSAAPALHSVPKQCEEALEEATMEATDMWTPNAASSVFAVYALSAVLLA